MLPPLLPTPMEADGLMPPFVLAFPPDMTLEDRTVASPPSTGPPVARLALPPTLTSALAPESGETSVLCPPSTGSLFPEGPSTASAPELEGKIVLSPPLMG